MLLFLFYFGSNKCSLVSITDAFQKHYQNLTNTKLVNSSVGNNFNILNYHSLFDQALNVKKFMLIMYHPLVFKS